MREMRVQKRRRIAKMSKNFLFFKCLGYNSRQELLWKK